MGLRRQGTGQHVHATVGKRTIRYNAVTAVAMSKWQVGSRLRDGKRRGAESDPSLAPARPPAPARGLAKQPAAD
jgi:hypothetical protein